MQALTPNASSTSFLLNFITYGATVTSLAIGIPTQCRSLYTQLYNHFDANKPKVKLNEILMTSGHPSPSIAELGSDTTGHSAGVVKSPPHLFFIKYG